MLLFLHPPRDNPIPHSVIASLALRTARESEFVAVSFQQPIIDAIVALYSPRLDPGSADLPETLPDGTSTIKMLNAFEHFCATRLPRFHFFRQLAAVELETPTPILVYDMVWQDFSTLHAWTETGEHCNYEVIHLEGGESVEDLLNKIRLTLG